MRYLPSCRVTLSFAACLGRPSGRPFFLLFFLFAGGEGAWVPRMGGRGPCPTEGRKLHQWILCTKLLLKNCAIYLLQGCALACYTFIRRKPLSPSRSRHRFTVTTIPQQPEPPTPWARDPAEDGVHLDPVANPGRELNKAPLSLPNILAGRHRAHLPNILAVRETRSLNGTA